MVVFNLFIYTPASSLSGGMLYILQLAKLLNSAGIRAGVWFNVTHPAIPEKYLPYCIFSPQLPKEWWHSIKVVPECNYKMYYQQSVTIPLFQGFAMGGELNYAISPCLTTTPYMRGLIEARNKDVYLLPLFIEKEDFEKVDMRKEGIRQPTLTPAKTGFAINQAAFIPKLSRELFLDMLKVTEHFVYPVVKEGFGLPVMEAMASGCIVYSGDLKGNSGFIREGVNGYWITNNQDFEEKLANHKKIGKQARDYVMTYHTSEACKDEVAYTFQRLLKRLGPYM